MTGIRRVTRTLVCAAAVTVSGAAAGETPWLTMTEGTEVRHGEWYIRLGGAGGIYQLPDWRGTLAAFNVITVTTKQFEVQPFDTDARMANAGFALGWYLPSADAAPIGRAPMRGSSSPRRISAPGAISREARPSAGATIAAFTTLDGRVATSAAITGAQNVEERLRVALDGVETGLRIATDLQLGGILVFPLGWRFRRLGRTPLRLYRRGESGGGRHSVSAETINEKLGVTRVGAKFSLEGRVPLSEQFALLLGARAGFTWNRVHLDGSDCGVASAANAAFACNNAPGTFVAGSAYATTASNSRSRFGFLGSATAALRWDLGFPVIALGAFFTYDTAVPGVRNPAPPLVNSSNAITAGAGRTSIFFENGYRAGGFVMLTLPFGPVNGAKGPQKAKAAEPGSSAALLSQMPERRRSTLHGTNFVSFSRHIGPATAP